MVTNYDDNFHSLVFWTGFGTDYPDQKYLGITGDVLVVTDQYDFVRLFINNILVEYYYLSDF